MFGFFYYGTGWDGNVECIEQCYDTKEQMLRAFEQTKLEEKHEIEPTFFVTYTKEEIEKDF